MAKGSTKCQTSKATVVSLPVRPELPTPTSLPELASEYPELCCMETRKRLKKIVHRQNQGKITRIYTTRMAAQLKDDLETLKAEFRIE